MMGDPAQPDTIDVASKDAVGARAATPIPSPGLASPALERKPAGGGPARSVSRQARSSGRLRSIRSFGMDLLSGSFGDMADWLADSAGEAVGDPTIVIHVNVYNYYLLRKDASFRRMLDQRCTYVFDGIGMKIGNRILGQGWIADLNGTDLFPLVMQRAQLRRLGVYFVGGRPATIERAVKNITRDYPGLAIMGWHEGYFGPDQEAYVAERVRRSGAEILLVGRGSLARDDFILKYADVFGAKLIWNVGGLFDFLSGKRVRAPGVVRRIRMEWLFRFFHDPRRMWRRNFIAAPWFILHALWWRMTGTEKSGDSPHSLP